MSLDATVTEFRELWARYAKSDDLGDPLIKSCIKQATRKFSRYLCRPNRKAVIDIVSTDESITLPPDFISCPLNELYLAISGINVGSDDIITILEPNDILQTRIYNLFDTQLGATDFTPPHFRGYHLPQQLRIGINDNGLYEIMFLQPIGINTTAKFFYGGCHVIANADNVTIPNVPAKNSIPELYKDIFLDVAFGYGCLARAKALLETDERNFRKVIEYEQMAEKYFKSLNDLAPLGSRG
jgi:hypothetical protein